MNVDLLDVGLPVEHVDSDERKRDIARLKEYTYLEK